MTIIYNHTVQVYRTKITYCGLKGRDKARGERERGRRGEREREINLFREEML